MFGMKKQETCIEKASHEHAWGKWDIVMKDTQSIKESHTNVSVGGVHLTQDIFYEWRPAEYQQRQCATCGLVERYALVTNYQPYNTTIYGLR